MTHTVTVQDRLDAHDLARSFLSTLDIALETTRAEVAYYDRVQVTGGYVLVAENGLILSRQGSPLVYLLYGGNDGLKRACNFTTQKEAEATLKRWNDALTTEQRAAGCILKWTSRDAAVRARARQLEALKKTAQAAVARTSDPYFDASPAGQDFEANEGRYL